MTRQRQQIGILRRTILGLAVVVGAAALYAPVANASPESDATDAINAAWDAAGGDGSTLGPRDGGVYAAGPGFGQNFAGGAIYFSPATGAKIMHGVILDKYRALGGPADSDLGFPNIDEGPGRVSPDSRNSTFSAGDNPVIFWTPDTGAWVVRGPINAAWDRLGGSAGRLGVPVADETYSGDVITQKFTGGQLAFDTRAKTFTTEPPELAGDLAGLDIPTDAASAIATAWRAAGGSSGPLGAKAGDQYSIGDSGAGQDFAGGKVFFSPETGAHAVSGDILAKYESIGGPAGAFGFPAGSEADGGVPDSRVQAFAAPDNPVIFWTKEHGAVIVGGAMKAAWDKLGGATGAVGVPVGEQNTEGTTITQDFSGGKVSWDSATGAFTTDPANLAESLQGLEVPAAPVPSTPPTVPEPEKDNALAWHNWWLWWIIPLALLILASLYAWSAMRRRRSAPVAEFDDSAEIEADARYDSGYDEGYGETREEPGHWARRGEVGEADEEEPGYLPLQPGWTDREAPSSRYVARAEEDLFTHRGSHEAEDFVEDSDDADAVDTAPTKVISAEDIDHSGRHAAQSVEEPRSAWTAPDDGDYLPGPGSLFEPVYGAAPPPQRDYSQRDYSQPPRSGFFGEREPVAEEEIVEVDEVDDVSNGPEDIGAPPAIHLPLDDPHQAPEGYPVKGSMRTGHYHAPGTPGYDETVAEIWFASEELAEANGFIRAD